MMWNVESLPPRLMAFIQANTKTPGSPTAGAAFGTLPGQKQNMSPEQVQLIINTSKKTRGYIFNLAANVTQEESINISGTANWLLGLVVFPRTNYNNPAATPLGVTLMINEEQAMNNHPFNLLDKKFIQGEYYLLPRPLGGQDSITMKFDNTPNGAQAVEVVFYYL